MKCSNNLKIQSQPQNFLREDFVCKIPPENVPRFFDYLQMVPASGFWDFKKKHVIQNIHFWDCRRSPTNAKILHLRIQHQNRVSRGPR